MRLLAEPHRGAAAPGQADRRKARRRQPLARAVLVVGELELDVARAQRRGAAPGERLVAPADHLPGGVDCLAEAVEPARLAGDIGLEALAGLDAVPAARHHR